MKTCESEVERCRRELAAIEAELRAGNPDIHGLCLGLLDWSAELRLLERELPLPCARKGANGAD